MTPEIGRQQVQRDCLGIVAALHKNLERMVVPATSQAAYLKSLELPEDNSPPPAGRSLWARHAQSASSYRRSTEILRTSAGAKEGFLFVALPASK